MFEGTPKIHEHQLMFYFHNGLNSMGLYELKLNRFQDYKVSP
jgi:hypothetical protein